MVAIASRTKCRGRAEHPSQEQWQWLAELLDHSLTKRHVNQVVDAKEFFQNSALDHALTELGMPSEQILEGLAFVCRLPPTELEFPSVQSLRKCHIGRMSRILPALAEHRDTKLFRICMRWLHFPGIVYLIDPNRLCRWLLNRKFLDSEIEECFVEHGLAILGPQRLCILAGHEYNDRLSPKIQAMTQSLLKHCLLHGS